MDLNPISRWTLARIMTHITLLLVETTTIIKLSLPLVLLWLVWFLWQRYFESSSDPDSPYPLPRGDMGWPLVGNTLAYLWNSGDFYKKRMQKYGRVFKLHIFGRPTVCAIGSDHFRAIVSMEHTSVQSAWPYSTRTLLGPGAMSVMDDPQHKARRKVVLSAFSHSNLSEYAPQAQTIIQRYLKTWLQQGPIKFVKEAKEMTFGVTCDILVGFCDLSTQDRSDLLPVLHDFIAGLFTFPVDLPGFQFHKSLKSKELLVEKLRQQIDRFRQNEINSEKSTVLSRIVATIDDEDPDISLDQLCDGVTELMFAGHDTTACAATNAVIALGQHPDIVDKLREEIQEFNVDGDVLVTFDTSVKMPYLNAVMTEVLFQTPPVAAGFRQTMKTIEIGGYQIPKGWKTQYRVAESHNLLADTDFRPERWLTTFDAKKQDQPLPTDPSFLQKGVKKLDHSLPTDPSLLQKGVIHFGGGPRSCVGKEFAKVMLRSFILELVKNCDIQLLNPKVDMNYFPMPMPKDDLPLLLTARKDRSL